MSILAVFLAALSSFMLGGLWYSPVLFGNMWNTENGGEKQAGHPAKVFGISFVFSLAAAAAFGYLLGPAPSSRRRSGPDCWQAWALWRAASGLITSSPSARSSYG